MLISVVAVNVDSLRRLQPTHSLIVLLCTQFPELLDLKALLQLVILLALAINLLSGSIWLLIHLSYLLDLQQMIIFIEAPLVVGRSLIGGAIGILSQLILLGRLIWNCANNLALTKAGLAKLVEVGLVALLQELLLKLELLQAQLLFVELVGWERLCGRVQR